MALLNLRKRLGLKKKSAEDGLDGEEYSPAESSQDAPYGQPHDDEWSLGKHPPRSSSGRSTIPELQQSPTSLSTSTTLKSTSTKSPALKDPLGLHVVYTPQGRIRANIVFVHGLGGTSRMTWSKNKDSELFWPQKFLPQERDIETARILTFGYNADVKSTGRTSISVLDFAKDLLYELKYSKDENTEDLNMGSVPLIFVAHSMGGLIVKEAYMQGQFDPEYEAIVQSVSAILFMSTPHRGTNLAETLNRILQVSFVSAPRQYINDLVKNSVTIQKINEQFRHLAPKLSIVSFYETAPTAIGFSSNRIMVLEKDSSVLGYPGEVSKPLDADHHTVCKFDSNQDRNYVTVRNYLKSHMSKLFIRNGSRASIASCTPINTRDLESFFAITDPPDTDYIFFRDRWTPGTCEWILQEPAFDRWLEDAADGPQLLWLHGPGGSGKSILASFIVNHLVESGMCCQYVFIRFGDQAKKSLSLLLRSLAFQLAQALPSFRNALGRVSRTVKLRGADPRTIWQRIFKAVLLRIELADPLYWVIDGLEECDASRQAVKLLVEVLQGSAPIRILALSRPTPDIEAELKRIPLKWQGIALEEHTDDYRVFIEQELEWSEIPVFKEKITEQLLETARGNFLWLKLTIDRINKCHTQEDVGHALQELPPGMEELFDRMAQSISAQEDTDRALTTSLLSWATCSFRLLTISDLSQALEHEAPHVLNLQRSIADLCGGFVVIDNGETVAMVHQTAREYLLSKKERPFNINRKVAHEKLFLRCLTFLATPGLRMKISRGQQPSFVSYAASYWPAHLWGSGTVTKEVVAAVVKFLASPSVLTWIQAVAQAGELHILIQGSTYLSSFASRLGNADAYKMPLERQIGEQELIKGWATDLSKIVGKFGSQLLRNPESIHKAIPPFCPHDSVIYKQFGSKQPRNIIVSGFSTTAWDDGVARLSLGSGFQATAILAEGEWILVAAIKDNSTTVFVYHADTYQEARRISHGERVRKFQVNRLGTLLITCGYSTTKVWDLSNGNCLAHATNPTGRPRPQAIAFVNDDTSVLISCEDRRQWLLSISGEDSAFEQATQIMDRSISGGLVNSPACAALSPDGRLLALGYRKSPLSIWEVDGPENLARCPGLERLQEIMWHPFTGEILGMHTGGVVFKWNPDGDYLIKVPVGASTMAISPEGDLLATGDIRGNISLFSTNDLGLLYRAVSQDPVIGIAFSADGLQLHDVRQFYGNIWEPNVLLKVSEPASQLSDVGSESDVTLSPQPILSETLYNKVDPITALCPQPNGRLYCTGTEEGVVVIHGTDKSKQLELSRSSSFMGIEQVEWNDDGTQVCCADLSRTVLVHRIKQASAPSGVEADLILNMSISDLAGNIDQVLFQPQGELLLVCNSSAAVIISVTEKKVAATKAVKDCGGKWITHPTNSDYLILIRPSMADIYKWSSLEKVVSIPLAFPFEEHLTHDALHTETDTGISGPVSHSHGQTVVTAGGGDSGTTVQKLMFTPSRQHLLVEVSMQIDDQVRSVVRLLDVATLSTFPPRNLNSPTQGSSDLALDAEGQSITSIELPSELVERFYRPLSFIQARGAAPDTLLFLDCDSSICSWSVPRRLSISSLAGKTSFPLSRSTPRASVSDMSLLSQSPQSRSGSLVSGTGFQTPQALSRRESAMSASSFQSPFAPSRSESAGSVSGPQSQITSHYCLPGDWVSPDCVKLMQTFGDGTLLCPRNGEVAIVRCTSLGG